MLISNSTVVMWSEKELTPSSILLTTSGSNGDRLLFWCPAPTQQLLNNSLPQPVAANTPTASTEDISLPGGKYRPHTSPETGVAEPSRHNPFALNLLVSRSVHHGNTLTSSGGNNSGNPVCLTSVDQNHKPISSLSPTNLDVLPGSSVTAGSLFRSIAPMTSDAVPISVGSSSGPHYTIATSSPLCSSSTGLTSDTPARSTSALNSSQPAPASSAAAAIVEGLPVNVLLSLLHKQSHDVLQRKVYLKLDRRVFVGAAFNLTPDDDELGYHHVPTSCDTINGDSGGGDSHLRRYSSCAINASSSSCSCTSASMVLGFSVVFVLDASAPPSVLSYYTELARLTGAQIRRAELIFNYLSDQYKIISHLLDNTGSSSSSSVSPPIDQLREMNTNMSAAQVLASLGKDHSILNSSQPLSTSVSGILLPPSDLPSGLSSCPPSTKKVLRFGTSAPDLLKVTPYSGMSVLSPIPTPECTNHSTGGDAMPVGRDMPSRRLTTREKLLQSSSLCQELKFILDSVSRTGHVVAQINKVYPVCFCLPHKAYCLNPETSPYRLHPTDRLMYPAIRPQAVWRAMDNIRPYHTVLLMTSKEELFNRFLPRELGVPMIDVIDQLSPSVSLQSLSLQLVSSCQHCLNTASWLVFRGHGIIIYPVVASNTYVLTPPSLVVGNGSSPWLTEQLIAQFAFQFPDLNLAEVLASFSIGLNLKEHQNPYVSMVGFQNRPSAAVDMHSAAGEVSVNGDGHQIVTPVDKFGEGPWHRLPPGRQVQLISWLLRRRLVIQIHTYVYATLHHTEYWALWSKKLNVSHEHTINQDVCHTGKSFFFSSQVSFPSISDDYCNSPAATPTAFVENCIDSRLTSDLPNELICRLTKYLPEAECDTLLTVILSHPAVESSRIYYRRHPYLLSRRGLEVQDGSDILLHKPIDPLSSFAEDTSSDLGNIVEPFSLFVHILPHLPAHLEELMFVVHVSRADLIYCIERFTPLLSTIRLPDPVTACFAGVE